MTAGIKIPARQNVLCLEQLVQLIAADSCVRADFDSYVLEIVMFAQVVASQAYSRNLCELFVVLKIVAPGSQR